MQPPAPPSTPVEPAAVPAPSWPLGWTAGALLCLITLTRWQRLEDLVSLALAVVGLLVTLALVRGLRRPRGAAVAAMGALSIALGVALAEQAESRALDEAGEYWSLAAGNADVARVADAISAAQAVLLSAAESAARSGLADRACRRGARRRGW